VGGRHAGPERHDGQVQVRVLGPVQVVVGGDEVELGGPRSRALVARLALDAGRAVSTAALIKDLWGDDLPADATNALQSVVSRTRRHLPAGSLQSTPAGYVLQADVDVAEFHRLVAQGRITDGLALWRGEALADVRDAPFADRVAVGLAEARLAAVVRDLASRRADDGLVVELASLVEEHPFRDGLWLTYLRALVACGRPSEALSGYERMRRRLADELGADPSAELQRLHTEILRSGAAAPPRRRQRLPAPVTSFVGRESAVSDVRAALERHRLVTITGPGGAGKTRLAVESARTCADRFPDVWLAELAALTGGQDVLPAVLAALGLLEVSVRDRGGPAIVRAGRLPEAIGDAEGLLILDNCEHVVDASAAVAAEVLARAPRVRVLATSRESLQITGESVYLLGPLAVPAETADLEQASGCGAVQLFVQRAQAVDHAFALDADSLPAVGEICRRLDGQPLALELAAARLRTLTVQQVADRLSDRFRLLTGGSRTALPRHRTLRAVVEWSWDLLEVRERDLAERVAVFGGGATVGGAAAVSGGPDGAGHVEDIERLLESLADRSLLALDRGTGRFHMLETLREFGTDRLVGRGIVDEVRSAHLDYLLSLAEQSFTQMLDERQATAIEALDAERGNLAAALRFAVDRPDRARAGRLVRALTWYWLIRNEHVELEGWVRAVLALPGRADPGAEIACAAVAALGCAIRRDDAGARALVGGILADWDAHAPDDPVTAVVMATLEYSGLTGGRVLPVPADLATRSMIGLIRLVRMENGGLPVDRALLAATIDGFRRAGGGWGLAASLGVLGTVRSYDGDFAGAIEAWAEAMPLLEGLGAQEDAALFWLRMQAVRMAAVGDAELTALRAEYTARLGSAEGRDGQHPATVVRLSLAGVEHLRGDDRAAAAHLRVGLAAAGQFTEEDGTQQEAMMLAMLARITAGCGDLEEAGAHLGTAARIAARTGDMPVVAFVAVVAADLARRAGDEPRAARLLGAAVALRGCADRSNRDAEELARQLRDSLGNDRFEDLYEEGAGLDQRAAAELTLRPA
jgi:predicted ATPase/DNA-binding SARP family transcriptional activator